MPSKRRPVPRTSLVLSGGNALGAYAAGAYEALHSNGHALDLVSGASIGAITAAIIAGNPPEHRVARLREFWQQAAVGSAWGPVPSGGRPRDLYNQLHAMQTLVAGRPGLFAPRPVGLWALWPGPPTGVGLYDAAPLAGTLERLIDFDRIHEGPLPIIVSAIDLQTGEAVYFDSRVQRIEPRHLLASTAFIPGFPPVEIDGRCLGDPGMFCNLPLDPVLGVPVDRNQLCFAIDLFDVQGERPSSIDAALERAQDIAFATQTLRTLQGYRREHGLRHRMARLARDCRPARARRRGERIDTTPVEADVVLIAYRPAAHEVGGKMLEYSAASIDERWASGRDDMDAALQALRQGRATRRDPGFSFYDCRRRAPREAHASA